MVSHLSLDLLSVTQAAAIGCYDWIGRGNEKAADSAAVEAMRKQFDGIAMAGRIVIGEGERDNAPMLYIGEQVGIGGRDVDIAVDPLEGTTICARAAAGALSVLAVAEEGCLLNAPDIYMDKIAVGPEMPADIINIDNTVVDNLYKIAEYKKVNPKALEVIILDRPRHASLIDGVRKVGCRLQLIGDGDIAAVIAVAMKKADLYVGIGGAPEGVIAAAALRAIGGTIYGRLSYKNDEERQRAKNMGVVDLEKVYSTEEMAKGEVLFVATGVTDGPLLRGVRLKEGKFVTESLIMSSKGHYSHKISTKSFT